MCLPVESGRRSWAVAASSTYSDQRCKAAACLSRHQIYMLCMRQQYLYYILCTIIAGLLVTLSCCCCAGSLDIADLAPVWVDLWLRVPCVCRLEKMTNSKNPNKCSPAAVDNHNATAVVIYLCADGDVKKTAQSLPEQVGLWLGNFSIVAYRLQA